MAGAAPVSRSISTGSAMAKFMATATARINGIGIQYDISGAGPPILFLNGHGGRARHWDRQRRALQLRYRVITFDDRTAASSPVPAEPLYPVPQMADDAITLVRQNGAVLPLKEAGTIAGGLPYQAITEVRNHLLVIVFSDDVRLDAGRMLERQIKARVPDANVIYTDPRLAGMMSASILGAAQEADKIVVDES